jgi:protein transport protein DSL1/ZW10
VQTDIRGLSQNSSSDVDEWIAQARRLQEDIERSKAVAREVVKEYEDGQNLSATVQDAKAKLALLQNETSFNRGVTLSLEETWSVDKDLNEAESTLTTGRLIELATNIKQLRIRTGRLPESNAKDINNARATRIYGAVVEGLSDAVNSMVEFQQVDKLQQVTVNHGNHGWCSTCNV